MDWFGPKNLPQRSKNTFYHEGNNKHFAVHKKFTKFNNKICHEDSIYSPIPSLAIVGFFFLCDMLMLVMISSIWSLTADKQQEHFVTTQTLPSGVWGLQHVFHRLLQCPGLILNYTLLSTNQHSFSTSTTQLRLRYDMDKKTISIIYNISLIGPLQWSRPISEQEHFMVVHRPRITTQYALQDCVIKILWRK